MQRPTVQREVGLLRRQVQDIQQNLPVFLAPSGLMGPCLNGARLSDISFGLYGGNLYIPTREGRPLLTGESLRASYAFAEPDNDHFDWLAARAHIVTGLKADVYRPTEPWQSDPWGGSLGSSTTNASVTIAAPLGNWQGSFYGFGIVSEDDSDLAHFSTPGGAINSDEQYSWDVPGVGHIGYLFHDFTTSETGNLTITFASGAGPRKVFGYMKGQRDGAVTVGAMVGETDGGGTAQASITLTDDIPAGAGVILVTASQGPTGFAPSDAQARPVVDTRWPETNLVPVWREGGQLFPILRDIGGLGQPGLSDVDGGSP